MTSKRGVWISRRGQADADTAIDLVIEHQPQSGEQIQRIADTLIEDSPYQARQTFSDTSIEDLTQGMRVSGFQGILIVRPHGDVAKQRSGVFQLVYGHRRRAAWRRVCAEQGVPCLLPVVVRNVNDEQMLTVGAQENLQRQDLDPIEEAQLVAWHERMFADKNQTEIGAMLGKSSDWISTRSRIHRLPNPLKERLKERPRAISQMLELGKVYLQQPELATNLAARVVQEELTLDQLRSFIRGYARPKRRGTATSVQEITNSTEDENRPKARDEEYNRRGAATQELPNESIMIHNSITTTPFDTVNRARENDYIRLLEQAAAILVDIATRAEFLPQLSKTLETVREAEAALKRIHQVLVKRTEM